MTAATDSFVIVQLYPDELGVTGDSGNVLALATRLTRSGATVKIVKHRRGDVLPTRPDIVIIGNGPLSAVRTVLGDLASNAAIINEWVNSGVPLLAVGAGMEALGTSITTESGEHIAGISVLPITTTKSGVRRVGYVVESSPVGELVGFEDHSSTTVRDGAPAFGEVVRGVQSLLGGSDGVVVNNAIGTRIQGPVLPLNPVLADHLIGIAATRRGLEWAHNENLAELDGLAAQARAVIVKNIDHDFSSI